DEKAKTAETLIWQLFGKAMQQSDPNEAEKLLKKAEELAKKANDPRLEQVVRQHQVVVRFLVGGSHHHHHH
uniref:De novo designed DBPro1156_2 binder n=1 Tax=synthetic construct TaxID=32630 RepID=UPI003753E802